jgi:hypothetical protein
VLLEPTAARHAPNCTRDTVHSHCLRRFECALRTKSGPCVRRSRPAHVCIIQLCLFQPDSKGRKHHHDRTLVRALQAAKRHVGVARRPAVHSAQHSVVSLLRDGPVRTEHDVVSDVGRSEEHSKERFRPRCAQNLRLDACVIAWRSTCCWARGRIPAVLSYFCSLLYV